MTKEAKFNDFNTTIKDIGGIKDFGLIFNILESYFSAPDSTTALITDENEFDIRTVKTRNKVNWAINKTILEFINEDHRILVRDIFQKHIPQQDKEFAFIWHFCLNDRLFREITINVFSKMYFSGRAQIAQEDIIAYIKSISETNNSKKLRWAEETIYRLATKYLNLMTKLDLVATGRIKSFKHIRPSTEAQVLFIYFAILFAPESNNILTNPILPACFISEQDIHNRLKKLSLKGFFNMNFTGTSISIELKHTYGEICDVLYN